MPKKPSTALRRRVIPQLSHLSGLRERNGPRAIVLLIRAQLRFGVIRQPSTALFGFALASISSRVSDYYRSIGASPRPGVSPQELTAFELASRMLLPEPVRQFYLVLDGLDGEVPEFGFHHLQLWRLRELSRVSDRVAEFRGIPDYGPIVHSLRDADQYVAFGDGAIWSHVLAFRLSADAGPIIWICGESYAVVASSFDEFWRAYLDNPDAMLWPSHDQVKSPDA